MSLLKIAAEVLDVKESTVYVWAERGIIPSYKFGRLVRFKKEDIDNWAESQKVKKEPVCDSVSYNSYDIRGLIENVKGSVLNSHTGKARTASVKGGE